jgi:predicted MFS family arabinose efflux permease
MPVGSGLAALLVPPVIAAVGWPGAWLLDALLAAIAALAVARWVPVLPGVPARRLPGVDGLLRAVRSPGVVCLAVVFALYAGQYLAVLGLFPAMLVRDGVMSLRTAGVLSGLAFLANAPGNLAGAYLQHRGVPRWRLIVAGSLCMATTVWIGQDSGLPLAVRVGAVALFSFTAGLVPSSAFTGVAALTAGTSAAGASVGLLMQGSSVGQLLVPPLAVAAGSSFASWTAQPAALACLGVLAVVGGFLYRRWDARPGDADGLDRARYRADEQTLGQHRGVAR